MPASPTSKPSALVVEWQMRLEDLRAKLRLEPQHVQAWQWRLEAKVLVFMLARYSELAALNPLPKSPNLYIAQNAFTGQMKERLSRLRQQQLLNDIEARNRDKYRRRGGFWEACLGDVDSSIQEQISRSSARNQNRRDRKNW